VFAKRARDPEPIDLPQTKFADRQRPQLSAGLHLTRVSRARISIRICTDTKINAVVKSLGLLIAKKNVR
jgi:hypothetical protein